MNLITIPYTAYEMGLPQSGQHILGQLIGKNIIVYQAFNPDIAEYAVKNQQLGGNAYSFTRMTWIKPNFLWMMYRAGWATKPNQERILAIEIPLLVLKDLIKQGVYTSYKKDIYPNQEAWQQAMSQTEVRLQWDPDHSPTGKKLERRAIQIGMKGEIAKKYATEWIVAIQDITNFVLEQGQKIQTSDLASLEVIQEELIPITL